MEKERKPPRLVMSACGQHGFIKYPDGERSDQLRTRREAMEEVREAHACDVIDDDETLSLIEQIACSFDGDTDEHLVAEANYVHIAFEHWSGGICSLN